MLHLIKLSVGSESADDVEHWSKRCAAKRKQAGLSLHSFHTTRMWPRRETELLKGGSIYWVVRGAICVRQAIEGFEEVTGPDGIRRCNILLNPKTQLTRHQPRRAFQGWRYLKPEDAPADLRQSEAGLPTILASELAELGLL